MRNELINLLKFIFILIVCFHHTGWWSSVMHHGYIVVEFFFIVSGYFLYQTYFKKHLSPKEYFIKRVERIYPTYLLILGVYLLFSILFPQFFTPYNTREWIIAAAKDVLLLQSVGVQVTEMVLPRFNPSDWYVSSFFWGSILLYCLLKYKKICVISLMLIVTCTYSFYFIFKIGTLNDVWGYWHIFYMPLFRGLAGLSTGILLAKVFHYNIVKTYLTKYILFFNIIACIAIGVIGYCIVSPYDYDGLCYLCFVCIIMNSVMTNGLNSYCHNLKFLKIIPDISLEILLLHQILIPVSVKFMSLIGVLDILYVRCILYAFIVIYISYLFHKRIIPYVQKLFAIINRRQCL